MDENELSYKIIGAALKVHTALGPGLLESVYETVLAHELKKLGFDIKTQVAIPFIFDDFKFDCGFRLDILVNDKVIIELKSVEELSNVHHKQLLTYIKLSNKKLGLLINFNVSHLNESIIRIVNKL
jgi:GxxExxY protein